MQRSRDESEPRQYGAVPWTKESQFMPDISIAKPMTAIMFQQPRVMNISRLIMLVAPEFSRDQLDALQRDATGTIHSLDNKTWISLVGWMDAVTTAAVQCRRSGLTVRVPRRKNATATLLAPGPNSPSATLTYKDKAGAQKERPM